MFIKKRERDGEQGNCCFKAVTEKVPGDVLEQNIEMNF